MKCHSVQLGNLCKVRGDLDGAEGFYRKGLALREQLAEETRTVEAYNDMAFFCYTLAIIRKPYDQSLLEKALHINATLAAQCPQVTRYSKNRDAIRQMLEQTK